MDIRWIKNRNLPFRNINPDTEIDGLYLVGHWTTPPAGQGGVDVVIYSGKTTARMVMVDLKKKRRGVGV